MDDHGIKLVKLIEAKFSGFSEPPPMLRHYKEGFIQNKAITNHNTITLLPIIADATCIIIIFASFSRLSVACK